MAFDNNPIVDDNSGKSEESVRVLTNYMNQRSGFLCRHETPDFGVDIEVELMSESTVNADKFPIQLKSSKNIKIVSKSNESFVVLQFKTARLGYLHRRMPMCGMIAYYDDIKKIMYYDFTEEIINRTNDFSLNPEWKEQETVSIYFPVSNQLNETTLERVHNRITIQHKNIRFAYNNWKNFNPALVGTSNNEDFHEEIDLKIALPILINSDNYTVAVKLISNASPREIISNKELCLFAAIIYCEVGDVIEAQYYINKCERFSYSKEDPLYELYIVIKPKIQLLLGNIEIESYLVETQNIYRVIKNEMNRLSVQSVIYHLKAINTITTKDFSEEFEKELLDFYNESFEGIEDKYKYWSLAIFHSETVDIYADALLNSFFQEYRTREVTNNEKDEVAKEKDMKRYFKLYHTSQDYLKKGFEFGLEKGNDLLKAESLMNNAKNYKRKATSMWLTKNRMEDSEKIENEYIGHINGLKKSFTYFYENSRYRESQVSLGVIVELKNLFEVLYERELDVKQIDDIHSNLQMVEREFGLPSYQFTDFIEMLSLSNKNRSLKEIIDAHGLEIIDYLAHRIYEASDLPEHCLDFIKKDIHNQYKFQKQENPYLELISRQDPNKLSNTYLRHPSYIILDKKKGKKYGPSEDFDLLLRSVYE